MWQTIANILMALIKVGDWIERIFFPKKTESEKRREARANRDKALEEAYKNHDLREIAKWIGKRL